MRRARMGLSLLRDGAGERADLVLHAADLCLHNLGLNVRLAQLVLDCLDFSGGRLEAAVGLG